MTHSCYTVHVLLLSLKDQLNQQRKFSHYLFRFILTTFCYEDPEMFCWPQNLTQPSTTIRVWVDNDRICIFGWTYPLRFFQTQRAQLGSQHCTEVSSQHSEDDVVPERPQMPVNRTLYKYMKYKSWALTIHVKTCTDVIQTNNWSPWWSLTKRLQVVESQRHCSS